MKKIYLMAFVVLTYLSASGQSQQIDRRIYKYININTLPFLSRIKPLHVNFKWNMKDSVQLYMNEGLNALDEGGLGIAFDNFEKIIRLDSTFWPAYFYRGQTLKFTGKLFAARQNLLKAISINPDVPEVHIAMGEIYEYAFQSLEAFDEYTKATQVQPSYTYGYYKLGNLALRRNDLNEAKKYYAKCNEVNPLFPDSYMAEGIVSYVFREKEKEAIAFFTKAIEVDSTFSGVYFWRGLVYMNQGKEERCLNDWNKLLSYHPGNAFVLTLRGFAYMEAGDFDKAFSDLKKAVLSTALDENQFHFNKAKARQQKIMQDAATYLTKQGHRLRPKALYNLKKSFCFMAAGKMDALEYAKLSARIDQSTSAYFMQGVYFERFDNLDSALRYYSKAIKLNDNDYEIFSRRSAVSEARKDWQGASNDLLQMERIRPGNPVNYRIRGILKYKSGDFDGAIADLTKILQNDSLDIDAFKFRAESRKNTGNFKGASADLFHVLKLVKETSDVTYSYEHLGLNYLSWSDTAKAITYFRKALSFQMEAVYTPRFLITYIFCIRKQLDSARLEIENIKTSLDNMQQLQASPYFHGKFTSIIESAKSDIPFFNGLIAFQEGHSDEAVKLFSKSISIKKDNPYPKYYRGIVLAKTGDIKKALTDFSDLKEVHFKDSEARYNVLSSAATN